MDDHSYKSFEELEAWKAAREVRVRISRMVKMLPSDERFRMVDQIIRSSRSIAANIAEGFGRFHYQENVQFCRQARGSLLETLEHLICAFDEDYITEAALNEFRQSIAHSLKILNGYIWYLQNASKNSRNTVTKQNNLHTPITQ